jgi:hypothetical protein
MAAVTIIFGTGWGRSGWNQGAWNQGGINSLSIASAVNSVSVGEGTGVTVVETGVQATYSFGTYSVGQGTGETIVESGVAGSFAIGTGYTVSGDATVSPTEVGSVSSSFSIGTYDVTGGISFSVTGVQAAGTTGTESVTEGTGVTVTETGVQGAGAIGTVSVASIVVGVTGIEISSIINSSVIWQPIVPSQSPGWIEIGNRDAA